MRLWRLRSWIVWASVCLIGGAGRAGFAAAPAEGGGDEAVAREIAGLITQLGDGRYEVRQAATEQLEALGLRAYKAVRAARSAAKDAEVQSRLATIELALSHYALWDGKQTMADYAQRLGLRETQRTLTLGDKKVPLKLVLLPAGEFTMGSPANEEGRQPSGQDETQHRVRLTRPFLMGETAVTQAQWRAVMGTDPSGFKGDSLPVEMVSWNDGMAFCEAVTKVTPGEVIRLPREAEWEFGCRGGTTTAFNFGPAADAAQANYMAKDVAAGGHPPEFRATTVPVATFKPNAWGLYDMHGNVWQWCWDRVAPYPAQDVTDPTGPAEGEFHIVRGGSWIDTWEYCRTAARERGAPDRTTMHIGFRVVMEVRD